MLTMLLIIKYVLEFLKKDLSYNIIVTTFTKIIPQFEKYHKKKEE